jgi:hypothetical protein
MADSPLDPNDVLICDDPCGDGILLADPCDDHGQRVVTLRRRDGTEERLGTATEMAYAIERLRTVDGELIRRRLDAMVDRFPALKSCGPATSP